MKINPFYDAWLFLSGNTDEHRASGVGWLLVALFLALVAASIWIAIVNWRQDPAQRTNGHLATWFMRVMIGVMFYQGSIWKLPFPVAGGFAAALRPIAEYAAFGFHRWIAQNIFIPLLPVLDPITYFLELSFGVAFILGFLVRPMAAIGILFVAQLWLGLYRQPEEWPWLYVFLMFTLGFFVVTNAGKSLGLDALLTRSQPGRSRGRAQSPAYTARVPEVCFARIGATRGSRSGRGSPHARTRCILAHGFCLKSRALLRGIG
jgi:uncharacterized membrane protein YphA (DoxX/SURF4 family)